MIFRWYVQENYLGQKSLQTIATLKHQESKTTFSKHKVLQISSAVSRTDILRIIRSETRLGFTIAEIFYVKFIVSKNFKVFDRQLQYIFFLGLHKDCQALNEAPSPPSKWNSVYFHFLWVIFSSWVQNSRSEKHCLPVMLKILKIFNRTVQYSALLHLPPLRFQCADGCWDRTQDRCNWCIGSRRFNH